MCHVMEVALILQRGRLDSSSWLCLLSALWPGAFSFLFGKKKNGCSFYMLLKDAIVTVESRRD